MREVPRGRPDALSDVPRGWTVLSRHPNPWGVVPVTDGGRFTPEYVTLYMDRVAVEASKRNGASRKHHYVPKSYLRQWCDADNMIRRIDTATGVTRQQSPTVTCRLRDFYRVRGPEGRQHNQVEEILSILDFELARLLDFLRGIGPQDDVTFDQFVTLGLSVALQHLRTPQFRRLGTARIDWLEQQRAQATDPRLGIDYVVRFAPAIESLVTAMFDQMWRMADEMITRELHIFDDPRAGLPTCDVPVLVDWSDTAGDRNPGLIDVPRIWWPISPRRVLCLDRDTVGRKTQFHRITAKQRTELQRLAIHGREQYLFPAPDNPDLPTSPLPRRQQLRVDCEPRSDGSCRVGFGQTYGTSPQDVSCDRHKRLLRPDLHS